MIPPSQELFADIEYTSYRSTSDLFKSFRPDVAILSNICVTTLELTICHETNLMKSKQYKKDKYKNIGSSCTALDSGKPVSNFTIEVSTLGLVS